MKIFLSTSPARCGRFTLRNPKSHFRVLFIHTSDYLRYLRRKLTVIHLPTTSENVTILTWIMQNFWNLTEGFFKRWRLWRELAGSGYNGPWLRRADTSKPTQSHQIVVDRTGEADWLIRRSYKLKLIWRMRRCVTPVGAAGDSRSRKSWTAAWSSPHIADSFTSPAMRNRVE